MQEYLAAAKARDWARAFGFFADDLVIRIPGRSSLAGEWRGRAAAVDYITAVTDRFGRENIELEVVDMLASDERVALLVVERFLGAGEPIEIRRSNVYRIEDDRIVEIWIYEADQYVVDDLLHPLAA
jgi:ketosteroid isomerase-like protein